MQSRNAVVLDGMEGLDKRKTGYPTFPWGSVIKPLFIMQSVVTLHSTQRLI